MSIETRFFNKFVAESTISIKKKHYYFKALKTICPDNSQYV